MLGDKSVAATIAVKDMEAAKKFYEGTLGLKKGDMDSPGGTMFMSGNSMVFVYPSSFAGTNKATAASWGVGDDFDSIVSDLKSKGVSFEHYNDLPDTQLEGDVHVMGEMKSAWFKDPDGNILNIVNQM
ncbi:VOC family protein [Candidatus Saccharibacteria bacterium]|nr:VOC family protein [Candidatus Saccharibacteria bacterium]